MKENIRRHIAVGKSGSYAAGTPVTIAASADSGYTFSGWTTTTGGTFNDPKAQAIRGSASGTW